MYLFIFWLRWVFTAGNAFSCCGGRGYFSRRARASLATASLAGECRLQDTGFSASSPRAKELRSPGFLSPRPLGPSWAGDWVNISCAARRILNHWTIREALDTSYKWNRAEFLFLRLAYFTQVSSMLLNSLSFFQGWRIFHCMHKPHFVYPCICWKAFRLLLYLGFCV